MLRFLLIPTLWLGCVLVLYSVPGSDLAYKDPWELLRMDKLIHVIMFLIMAHSLIVAFRKQRIHIQLHRMAIPVAITMAIAIGAGLECVQSAAFVDRTTDFADFVANSIGALAAPLMFRAVYGRELSSSQT